MPDHQKYDDMPSRLDTIPALAHMWGTGVL